MQVPCLAPHLDRILPHTQALLLQLDALAPHLEELTRPETLEALIPHLPELAPLHHASYGAPTLAHRAPFSATPGPP